MDGKIQLISDRDIGKGTKDFQRLKILGEGSFFGHNPYVFGDNNPFNRSDESLFSNIYVFLLFSLARFLVV